MLEKSRALGEEASSDCKTAILHLTDGTITQGMNSDGVSLLIDNLNAEIGAEIFTFALGPEADKVTWKATKEPEITQPLAKYENMCYIPSRR